ncbi:AMP-binding protein [Streptomonospora algeriensis]
MSAEEQLTGPEIARPMRSLAAVTARLLVSGGPFEMETAEIGGVATRVWKHAPGHMRALVESSLEHGDTAALVYGEERVTHAEFYRHTAALARRLVDDYGVAKGDRVAIAMRNYPEWVVAYFAATSIGAIAVPLNSWWSGPELEFGLSDSGATVLVADRERIERLGEALERLELSLIGVRTEELPDGARSWGAVLGEPGFAEEMAVPVGAAEDVLAEVEAAAKRVMLARRFYNNAVAGIREARSSRLVWLLRLAGSAPMPEFFEMDDEPPATAPA